jgi:putative Mn2+ efflux pump MntP
MLKTVVLIVPLGLDTFAVAAALGLVGITRRERQRVALVLTSIEGAMPLIGLALGATIGHSLSEAAEYLAIVVLFIFGGFMVFGRDADDEEVWMAALLRTGGLATVTLGLSVSVDELAIGFTLGLLQVPLVPVLIAIALQTFVAWQAGLHLGGRLSGRLRAGTERIAGLLLTVLAGGLFIEAVMP